ncbi:PAAR domain-containing protein [Thalassomonas haliotis]|uniref:PAAR domain-containing protein n=1 Tax=Thalassomonas haliotis TaxID=485448 RepID=A0ABY7VBP5_9GAMM|nr:PAAR domain-containing protein [Thalassomonas haliotis]
MALPAATATHMHVCPKTTGTVPHIGGPIVSGSPNVSIGNLPAARIGDSMVCVGPPDKITQGSTGVFINGKGAARLGDSTAHGGKITIGNPTVLIGDSAGAPDATSSLQAKKEGTSLDKMQDVLPAALKNSRSTSEALGKAGMEQAKNRLDLKTDKRYVDRYHGPDDISQDKSGNLTEIEAKGNNKNSKAVTVDNKGHKQSSKKKNKRRADKMLDQKAKKIDIPSKRQGGPYNQDEINLWNEIELDKGNKRHLSTHTNTENGQVLVFERDDEGDIIETLDDFKIDGFDELKQNIGEFFK